MQPTAPLDEARAISSTLTAMATPIAALIKPPFTKASHLRIAQAMASTQHLRHRLAILCGKPGPASDMAALQPHRLHLSLWLETEALLTNMRPAPRKVPPEAEAMLMAYERGFYHLQSLFAADSEQARTEYENGRHADIPLPFTRFLSLVLLARRLVRATGREGGLRFLDVGCGGGLKLLQARGIFENVTGLEYDNARAQKAAGLMGQRAQVLQGDALDFDGYGAFNVIYAYQPLSDAEKMIAAERRILSQAAPGTVLIMPYSDFERRHGEYPCTQIDGPVYLAKLPAAQIAAAKRRLPMIGHCLPTNRTRDEGFAKPLRDALRQWGHLA